jgi:hypothetical protein
MPASCRAKITGFMIVTVSGRPAAPKTVTIMVHAFRRNTKCGSCRSGNDEPFDHASKTSLLAGPGTSVMI